ncbi:hypothetical protein AJ80_04738 [Polytolypa hystricis UAMH7299]|uniref:Methyltransferase type 11 domain-containing protein n=1 Tax=Polytolypa hystricis (strain UAMH7299) TaxID=1447883 RepID=A0A2B7Y8N0_POLH7|nr:hypothetical protein AJ80_04738 [Polytolypa hystricis UAMH7299]
MATPHSQGHEHAHPHTHGHGGHGHTSLAEKNKEYWNSAADKAYTEKWTQDMQVQIKDHLTQNLAWLGINKDAGGDDVEGKKMLEYACGNGLPSRIFSPYFSQCIGIDISQGMVNNYNAAAQTDGIPSSRMYAVQGDLTAADISSTPTPSSLCPLNAEEFFNFDLIVISLALHHIEDQQTLLTRFVERLNPSGRVLVIDLLTREGDELPNHDHQGHKYAEDGKGNAAIDTIHHDKHSFSKEDMEKLLVGAGCKGGVGFELCKEVTVVPPSKSGEMQMFFALGTK